jgi:peptidyl-prolyl cis-trans isomerase B (cyclophilin B)
VIRRPLAPLLVVGACASALLVPGAQAASGPHFGSDGCDHARPPAYAMKRAHFSRPGRVLKPGQKAKIVLVTSCGRITVQLVTNPKNPIPNSIAFLVTKHLYDGLVIFRDSPNFVVQTGDPKNNGTGGPGYEVHGPAPQHYVYKMGDVAMAKAGNDPAGTAGSQFFVLTNEANAAELPTDYGLLGHAYDKTSIATIRRLREFATPDPPATPSSPLYIWSARLVKE